MAYGFRKSAILRENFLFAVKDSSKVTMITLGERMA